MPDGAKVFSVTGASSPEQARQFWVGWQVKKRLYMQALMQQGPIGVDLAADETPLFPAVMDDAGVAALYSLRPAADHVALWRHVFTGAIKTKATVAVEALTELPGGRLYPSSAPFRVSAGSTR